MYDVTVVYRPELRLGFTVCLVSGRGSVQRTREGSATIQDEQLRMQQSPSQRIGPIDAPERGIPMSTNDRVRDFDDDDSRAKMDEYREEASQKYGKEVVDESYRRVGAYSKEQWAEIQAEGSRITVGIAGHMAKGSADAEVQELIAEHFRYLNDHFSTYTLEVYRGLGNLYVDDSRFAATFDKVRPGLAPFMRDAMHAYCEPDGGEGIEPLAAGSPAGRV